MAHFARVIDGIVVQVIVVNNADTESDGIEDGAIGAAFCHNLLGGEWLQTSFNTVGGVHNGGGAQLRYNYAGVGYTYDAVRDAFIAPKPPFPSYVLNEATLLWETPVPYPTGGGNWTWDEATVSWVEIPPD